MRALVKRFSHGAQYLAYLAFSFIITRFSIEKGAHISSRIFRFIGPYLKVDKIARANITASLKCDSGKLDQVMEGLWDNFGRFAGEFAHLRKMLAADISSRVEIKGLDHIKKLIEEGRPFFLFSGHFANWDFALRAMRGFCPKLAATYRAANNPYMEKIINTSRSDTEIMMISKGLGGHRALARALKNNFVIAMLVDQKMNEGIDVPFFGRSAKTANAIAKIAIKRDYPIFPVQIIRKKDSFFQVVIHKQLKESKGAKDMDTQAREYQIMLQINKMFEAWIRQHPSQWLWFHNRW